MRNFIIASENIASAVHVGLKHNGHPTYEHLVQVVDTIKEFEPEATDELIASGWLHDSLKYTSMTVRDISMVTTRRVAHICEVITDPGDKIIGGGKRIGANRKEVKAALYAQFVNEPDKSVKIDASFIKCVDRIVNMRSANTPEKIKTYIEEFPEFMHVYGAWLGERRKAVWFALFEEYHNLCMN